MARMRICVQWRTLSSEEGTPQGGIISPTLANMALDGLQDLLEKSVKKYQVNYKKIVPKIHLVRYADDFIVTAKDKETIEQVILPLVRKFLAERGLTLSEEKTKITHINEGFDFLGFNIRKFRNNTLLTTPSKDAQKRFCEKIRKTIEANKCVKQKSLIMMLNPIIKGWVIIINMVLLRMYSTEWIGKSSRKYGNGQDADIRRNVKDG